MNTKSFLSILTLMLVILAGGTFMYTKSGAQETTAVATSQNAALTVSGAPLAQATNEKSSAVSSHYKDGTYTAIGDFAVPEGRTESISVTVTLKGGIITDSTVTGSARNHDSRRFEQQFISGYQQQVIGKSIETATLGAVSGSSLTGNGWNSAIESIKSQAAV